MTISTCSAGSDGDGEITILPALAEPSDAEEAHHRIANNLQMLAATIALEARAITEVTALAALETTQRRISAVARVHRQLCVSPQVGDFDLAVYLHDLCRNLESMHDDGAVNRSIVFEAEPAMVRADHGAAIGMIVSELVTNACKHAYAPDEAGSIAVVLRRTPHDRLKLEIADTGRGFRGNTAESGIGSSRCSRGASTGRSAQAALCTEAVSCLMLHAIETRP